LVQTKKKMNTMQLWPAKRARERHYKKIRKWQEVIPIKSAYAP